MTALVIASQIPTNIDTLEKLHAWSGLALRNLNPTLEATEGVGVNELVAQAGTFYIPSANQYRMLVRTSLLVSPDHLAGGLKPWQYVQPFSNTALPTGFTS